MAGANSGQILVLRENAEWLRYVLWACAIGMSLLVARELATPTHDPVKLIACALGVLLLGFSGHVLRTRRVTIDRQRREVVLTSRSAGQTDTQIVGFDQIRSILIATTLDSVEDARGGEVLRERWSLALRLEDGSVPLTTTPYVTRQHADRVATRLKELLRVEIVDGLEASLDHLIEHGRRVEAVALSVRAMGLTTEQAQDFVDGKPSRTSSPTGG